MTYCAHCGRRVDWKFCPFCGANLSDKYAAITIGDNVDDEDEYDDEEEPLDFLENEDVDVESLGEKDKATFSRGENRSAETWSENDEEDPGLEYEKHENGYVIKGPGSFNGPDLIIPSTHGGLPVTGIADFAFSDADFLVSVVIPSGVVSIGLAAFNDCLSLREISIPQSVVRIGSLAFSGTDLKKIKLPEDISVIENTTFSDCSSLEEIEIPMKVTEIGSDAFYKCKNLSSVTFHKFSRLRYIFSGAFAESGLTSISFPDNLFLIGPNSFRYCNNLTKIVIPKSVGEVSWEAFSHCASLSEVKFSGKDILFGDQVFLGCEALSSVFFPKDVFSITFGIFRECSTLKHVTLPDGVWSIGSLAFLRCNKLKYIIIPSSVGNIDNWAFGECRALTEVYYKGDRNAWKNIEIGAQNDALTNCRVYFYSEERPYTGDLKPLSSSRYWHLKKNGDPEIWR